MMMDPFTYLDSLGQFTIKPGLARMNRTMGLFDNPHLSVPSILVAGTNGKGSVCHMVDAALSRFPLKRVLYTSPHLNSLTERIVIDSKEIDRDSLGQQIDRVRTLTQEHGIERLTYFETLTAACFSLLPRIGTDVLVSEVGLGGRWDATNILEPQACAITSISLDHTELLGEDVVSITNEKAGIIKPSTPLVMGPLLACGDDRTRCIRTILEACSKNGSPVVLTCRPKEVDRMTMVLEEHAVPDWMVIEVSHQLEEGGTTASIRAIRDPDAFNPEPRLGLLGKVLNGEFRTPLLGAHQAFNTACALSLALLVLPTALARSRLKLDGDVPLEELVEGCIDNVEREFECKAIARHLSDGLSATRMIGRMERRTLRGATVYLDGGHNVEAGSSVASTIKALHPDKRPVLLFSMMRDKDPVNYLRNMSGSITDVVLLELPLERGMPLERLKEATEVALGNDIRVFASKDIERAVDVFNCHLEREGLGIVCGSFYLYNLVSGLLH